MKNSWKGAQRIIVNANLRESMYAVLSIKRHNFPSLFSFRITISVLLDAIFFLRQIGFSMNFCCRLVYPNVADDVKKARYVKIPIIYCGRNKTKSLKSYQDLRGKGYRINVSLDIPFTQNNVISFCKLYAVALYQR